MAVVDREGADLEVVENIVRKFDIAVKVVRHSPRHTARAAFSCTICFPRTDVSA